MEFANAGVDMTFSFPELVTHAAKTRRLRAGTMIGSGTISNSDQQYGYLCIAEIRMIEAINEGAPHIPFSQYGNKITLGSDLVWNSMDRSFNLAYK